MNTLQDAAENLYANLIKKIDQVKLLPTTTLKQSEEVISLCLENLRSLRNLMKSFRGIKTEEEIYFFKEVKPRFVSQYFLHVKIFKLYSRWPMGNDEVQRNYLQEELQQINHFFEQNRHFCCYYRTGSTYLDHTYFVRGKHDIEPSLDHLFCETDPKFNTPRDLMVAQLIANDLFLGYVEEQLCVLSLNRSALTTGIVSKPLLTWTDSKSALVELIYGLHECRVFNGGQADIKTITAVMEKAFQIDLKNYYDLFLHIKMRKLEPTKFLDCMKHCLLQKLSDSD